MFKIKCLVQIAILLNVTNFTFCTYLKAVKRDNVFKSVVQNLTKENQLTGFLVCNLILKTKNSQVLAKSNELLREVSSLSTVVNINPSFVKNLQKFKRNVTRFPSTSNLIHTHVVANDRVYLIVLINYYFLQNQNALIRNARYLNQHFSSVQGVSKTLLVSIVEKPFKKYRKLLQSMANRRFYLYNIDVLEVVTNRQRPASRSNYKVIQFDYFKNVLRVIRYSKNHKFFRDSMKNLHRMKLGMSYMNSKSSKSRSTKKSTHLLVKSLFEFPIDTIVRQLNGTFSSHLYKKQNNCFFNIELGYTRVQINQTRLFPARTDISYYIVPTLCDEIQFMNYKQFFSNSLTLAFIIVIFHFYMKFFDFDPQTWQTLRTFSMIIGVSNPRDPMRFGETIAFTFLIVIGFFFGGDLIFGLISINVVQTVERKLESASDLIQNNISLIYFDPSEKRMMEEIPNIKWSKRNYLDNNLFHNMFIYKNESLPSILDTTGLPFPSKIMINNAVYAKKSKIQSIYSTKYKWYIPRNCPWSEHLSYSLLKFYENHLDSTSTVVKVRQKIFDKHLSSHIDNLIFTVHENREAEYEDLNYLWLLICIGFLLPLFALAIEILFKRQQ